MKSDEPIRKLLLRENVPKRKHPHSKISKDDEITIINLYDSGLSEAKIAKQFNVSASTIGKVLDDNNHKARKNGRIHNFDEDYFKEINNQNKAYLLGFIFADGFIRKDNLVLSIIVHNKDIEILNFIKYELKTSVQIENIKSKNHNRINLCSKDLCNDLNRLGCYNGKTYSLEFPTLKNELINHFVRGFLDGDGCISITNKNNKKYCSISFTGTFEMMHKLKQILNVDNRISFYRNAYALHIGKQNDVIRILNWLYKDANLYLERKYIKYKEIKKYLKGDNDNG